MNLYTVTIPLFTKTLTNMLTWMDKADAFAATKKFDANWLLQSRVAPDMFPLVRQMQSCCDIAKLCAARLTGKEAPKHPDTETTFAEMRTRIQETLAFLATMKESDFAGAEKRQIELSYIPGKFQEAADYTFDMAVPNFYFHATTAYALFRHAGVDVGKMDYLGNLNLKDKPAAMVSAQA